MARMVVEGVEEVVGGCEGGGCGGAGGVEG